MTPRHQCTVILIGIFILTGCTNTGDRISDENGPLRFMVLGDTAYNPPEDYQRYRQLIAAINRQTPAFSIHIGDTKGGGSCGDEQQLLALDFLNQLQNPVVYTPGDNEWTDCHRQTSGGFDPYERLNAIRRIFFSKNESHGKNTMPVQRQAQSTTDNAGVVENMRWRANDIQFMTLHIPGSNNDFPTDGSEPSADFVKRNAANLAWFNDTVDAIENTDTRALVIAFHADMFISPRTENDGFTEIKNAFAQRLLNLKIPTLLIHGDYHTFKVDRPFARTRPDNSKAGGLVYRLETFGAPELKAVLVTIDDGRMPSFSFTPVFDSAEGLRNQ